MKNGMSLTAVAFSLLLASAVGSTEYLYTPVPADSPTATAADGVLVREVTVRKGDTLHRLSRQFSGKGGYYPQILLFNDLKNPNLIHPGEVLRIPVTRRSGARESAAAQGPTAAAARRHAPAPAKRHADTAPARRNTTVDHGAAASPARQPASAATAERSAYAGIEKTLRTGDCRAALPLLDTFIATYPDSPLAPEAALNRAECYLKISAP